MLDYLQRKLNSLQFSRKQQQGFLEDVSQLILDGVPANQAVETIAQISKGKTKEVAKLILQKIALGRPLAEGMQDWFPQPIVEIVRAGEEGGTLAENMAAAVRALASQTKGMASLINSLVYPLTVIAMGLFVSVFIKHSVFTNFIAIKPMSQWPQNGVILYTVATFTESYWWIILILIIATIFAIGQLLREVTGDTRTFIDKIPVFSLYRQITAARFMETLGLLLSNGIVLKRALVLMRANANHYLMWHIYKMELRLSGGRENIAEVLDTGLIPDSDILRLRVIAKGKGFEHALVRMGVFAANNAAKSIEVTGKVLGISLLLIGAMWAIFMILAIYSVGFSLAS